MFCGPAGHFLPMHIVNMHLVLPGQLLDGLNGFLAGLATRAENLDLVFHWCNVPFLLSIVVTQTNAAGRGHEFQTEATIRKPTPAYVTDVDSR